MRFVPILRTALLLLVALGVAQAFYAFGRSRPQDLPWTALDLAAPVGMFTGRKLAALPGEPGLCRALLDRAGARFTALPPRHERGGCGYDDAVRRRSTIDYVPAGLGTACPVAAALLVWEREVVQPAAMAAFGRRVVRIDHFGSYSCRRLYGRDAGAWSEHATASAVDIAGFRLAGGRRITVAGDWNADSDGRAAAFLHAVRDGACALFSTTLSPDYNAAHRDHLHLDQAARGAAGWRVCR